MSGERQVWPNTGARPNWQSNMVGGRGGKVGFQPRYVNPLSDLATGV